MKTVCKLNQCCGCKACVDICRQKAVTILDNMDALNAIIDQEKCISCGKCYQLCPNNEPATKRESISWYQGWAKSEKERAKSSSGGFATAIAKAFVQRGGIVCSCSFSKGKFGFSFAETEAEVERFRGSKYVKSDPQGCYEKALHYIKTGRELLFIGLPCQVAAIQNYVGKRYEDRLYTVDLICHGTPSVSVLQRYLTGNHSDLGELVNITFRKNNRFGIFEDENPVVHEWLGDNYIAVFLNALAYTENCYSCQYAEQMRVSDLTLGDSWGSDLGNDEIEKGISLALAQTKKGEMLLSEADLLLFAVDYDRAVQSNTQLKKPSAKPKNREIFLQKLMQGGSFDSAYGYLYPKQYMKQRIKRFILNCKTGKVDNS